jgi:exonuclease SbcD
MLRDHSRAAEHAHFLRWLVDTVVAREVDALLLAGDVFDAANPSPAALRLWFGFLGELKRARPAVQVVVIAGNHDSAARLEAPRELLAAFDVRVVGAIEREAGGALRTEPLLVPLRDRSGATAAWCVAIPFLRGSDLAALVPSVLERHRPAAAVPPDGGAERRTDDYVLPRPAAMAAATTACEAFPTDPAADPLIEGMRALHAELFAAAAQVRQPGQALVAMAHGYLVGGALSELSERKVLGGNQHALPIDLFPPDCAYVALGHLHRPQPLAGHDHIRYSGSPIPLSMPERLHAHHVVCCDLDGERVTKIWSLRVPRLVPLLRLPEHGALLPDAALAAVAALPPRDPSRSEELRPLVEVAVQLPQPSPQLGERIAQAIASRDARLVRVDVQLTGTSAADAEAATRGVELATLAPEEVFLRRYHRDHAEPPPAALLAAFRELLEQVETRGGG